MMRNLNRILILTAMLICAASGVVNSQSITTKEERKAALDVVYSCFS